MFAKFNYKPEGFFYNTTINRYLTIGQQIYEDHKKDVQECLSNYITEDGVIRGSDLKNHWFSVTPKDVFISHSHNDLSKVQAFAGWLHEIFGIEAFIDSCSWGYCDDLLRKIDNRYCYDSKSKTYNYKLRNYTTSHVHMMLSTALAEMIDKTECLIFFNTPNSINMEHELGQIKKKGKSTLSPWIYHELSMTTMLEPKNPDRRKSMLEHFEHRAKDDVKIQYDVTKALEGMTQLTDEILMAWSKKCEGHPVKISEESLDALYEIVFPK